MITEYHEQYFINQFKNLDAKLTQEEIDNIISSVSIKEMEFLV